MGRKALSLIIQKLQIHRQHGEGAKVRINNDNLTYVFEARPTSVSKVYQLRLNYNLWSSPDVYLLDKNLEAIEDPNFPHIYERDILNNTVRLCLYFPLSDDWNRSMLLVDTIIPWTVEWLFYYEIWLITGKWKGGGIHPTVSA